MFPDSESYPDYVRSNISRYLTGIDIINLYNLIDTGI
nr:MAG TPA: hypothetical protein [Caudoviricetes sp.]